MRFEFDLPYPDGTRLGLAGRALEASRLVGGSIVMAQDWSFQDMPDFDAHVRRHLPWYDLASSVAAVVARHYVPRGGRVYDIGASTGHIGNLLRETLQERNAESIALDEAESMVARYSGPGRVVCADALSFAYEEFDVAFLFLVLMFLPVARRANLLRRLRSRLRAGGALVIFDRCVPESSYAATVMRHIGLV